jgi:hypothetical protein
LLLFSFGPYGWQIRQHLSDAALDGFYRKFPAVGAIYLAHDYTDDVDKGLQSSTSLVSFLVMIIGWRKEAVDMINDLVTQNEGLFFRCAGCHAAAPDNFVAPSEHDTRAAFFGRADPRVARGVGWWRPWGPRPNGKQREAATVRSELMGRLIAVDEGALLLAVSQQAEMPAIRRL